MSVETLRCSYFANHSLTNVPAMMFYTRLGWHTVGSRPNVQPMAIMELDIA